MAECAARYSWNPTWRCHRRGLPRLCVEHLLDRCRWEWRRGNFRLSIDLSSVNRLTILIDEDRRPGERPRWWAIDYGNSGCDPAVSLGWDRTGTAAEAPIAGDTGGAAGGQAGS